jgi:toxin ParE1/3/4
LKLRWTRLALQDLENAYDYIAGDNIQTARVIAKRIDKAARKVAMYPLIGRPGIEPGTREWVVSREKTRTPRNFRQEHSSAIRRDRAV